MRLSLLLLSMDSQFSAALMTFFVRFQNSLLFYSLWTDFCLTGLSELPFNSLVGHKKLVQNNMCVFLFFEKLKPCIYTICARFPSESLYGQYIWKVIFVGALKNLSKFSKSLLKKARSEATVLRFSRRKVS